MRSILVLIMLFLSTSVKSQKKQQKNILLICIDDLRPELKSFGVDYIISPNIDKLAESGRAFQNHYVNAPSCGPSRYTLLTGTYGAPNNDALFLRAKKIENKEKVTPSMPEWFRNNGYTTVSVGKVSHHPGGRGGGDWDDNNIIEIPEAWDRHIMPVGEWQHPRGAMHGLAHGEIRVKAGDMDLFQAEEGQDNIYPDGLIVNEGIKQLETLTSNSNKPFFLAIGILKPHLPFGAPKKYLDMYENIEVAAIPHPNKPNGKTTWHGSGEFMQYNRWGKNPNEDVDFAMEVKKHYAACVTYADAQIGKILKKLKETGADKNTIIVLWGDHGWNLGEHAIWGKHNLFEEGLRSPLIIAYPGMKKQGKKTNAIVEASDIFPTLCDLTKSPIPDFVKGVSLVPILKDANKSGHPAIAYNSKASTIRTNTHRLTVHKDGFVELYDHISAVKETVNIAEDNLQLVKELTAQLKQRITE
jgi:iduronate 2-sulfatase